MLKHVWDCRNNSKLKAYIRIGMLLLCLPALRFTFVLAYSLFSFKIEVAKVSFLANCQHDIVFDSAYGSCSFFFKLIDPEMARIRYTMEQPGIA